VNKNARVVLAFVIVAVVVIFVVYIGQDLWKGRQRCFDCEDGQRCTIDTRKFATQYSAYSLELEASVNDKARMSAKVSPVQLEKLSEAAQNAREFRQYVVVGFNSCAISKVQYGQLGPRFQAMDSMAREINELTTKPSLSEDERARLANLIDQYGELARKLGT
jgi:hypothetical protein